MFRARYPDPPLPCHARGQVAQYCNGPSAWGVSETVVRRMLDRGTTRSLSVLKPRLQRSVNVSSSDLRMQPSGRHYFGAYSSKVALAPTSSHQTFRELK